MIPGHQYVVMTFSLRINHFVYKKMGFSEYESELKFYKYSLKSVNILPWMIYTSSKMFWVEFLWTFKVQSDSTESILSRNLNLNNSLNITSEYTIAPNYSSFFKKFPGRGPPHPHFRLRARRWMRKRIQCSPHTSQISPPTFIFRESPGIVI